MSKLLLDAEWRDDCQGKKDYDASILEISTRYWPRGGGFSIFDRENPQLGMQGNETRPEIVPSAHSSLIIRFRPNESLQLIEADFKAETEAEVKALVETWAQAQMDKAVSALREAFTQSD